MQNAWMVALPPLKLIFIFLTLGAAPSNEILPWSRRHVVKRRLLRVSRNET